MAGEQRGWRQRRVLGGLHGGWAAGLAAKKGTGRTTWRVSSGVGGKEGYWTDYMAGEQWGWRQRRVLDGLHGGRAVGLEAKKGTGRTAWRASSGASGKDGSDARPGLPAVRWFASGQRRIAALEGYGSCRSLDAPRWAGIGGPFSEWGPAFRKPVREPVCPGT